MLASLRIRNLALVEELEWQPGPGFVAITGETGSGKSIIVGALKLALGERADKTLIRSGADTCTVEAIFTARDAKKLNAWLEEQGVEPCEDEQLIVKRVFTAAGVNRQFVNGSATTLNVLKELGDGLVDLHGPHDHQSLLSNEKQLDLLDAFSGAEALRSKFEEQYRALNRLTAERDELASSEAAAERELDLLRHQVNEIEAAALKPDEEEETVARYTIASNGRRLMELSGAALGRLRESDDSALTRLNEVGRVLRDLERVDPGAKRFSDMLVRGLAEIEDLASGLSHYAEELDLEPGALAELEERVSLFETLKRKYGGSIAEVIAFGEQAAARLRKIESRSEEIERLGREIEKQRKAMIETAGKLSAKRKAAAPKLGAGVTSNLRDLGFKKSDFSVALRALEEPGPHGMETVEFVFAPNPGEPAKPLKAIASSGEISRVMLAVKSSLATQDTIAVLVFDEIDANVGGEIAHAVGSKMKAIAKERQVLAITHLPQVASEAGSQFVVTKDFGGGRTVSTLTEVKGAERANEIARMLGGKGESALAHAKTLLRR
ncbi:MAG: DNA repair protein RecN [Chthoniobacteraceae bacterium]